MPRPLLTPGAPPAKAPARAALMLGRWGPATSPSLTVLGLAPCKSEPAAAAARLAGGPDGVKLRAGSKSPGLREFFGFSNLIPVGISMGQP